MKLLILILAGFLTIFLSACNPSYESVPMEVIVGIATSIPSTATETDIPQKSVEEEHFGDKEGGNEWHSAYVEFLSDFESGNINTPKMEGNLSSDRTPFMYIEDINDCGIPEAVFATNPFGRCILAYYLNGEINVLELPVESNHGFTRYIPETGQIINMQSSINYPGTYGVMRNYALYDWSPDGYVQTVVIDRDPGSRLMPSQFPPDATEDYFRERNPNFSTIVTNDDGSVTLYGQGYINGEAVSFEEFELKKAELDALAEQAEEFPLVYRDDVGGDFDFYINEKLFY